MASTTTNFSPLHGGCLCKAVTYTLTAQPLVTHCCHCSYCQRESGSAFALNSLIEDSHFQLTSSTSPVTTGVPSQKSPGKKHPVVHCPTCATVLYHDLSVETAMLLVKTATLDDAGRKRVPPDVHIFTSSKVQWVDLTGEEERGGEGVQGFLQTDGYLEGRKSAQGTGVGEAGR